MIEQEFEQFRIDHALRADVWRSQFENFTTVERTRSLYFEDDLARNQRAELSKMVAWMERVGGVIIHRTPIPGRSRITPELRPNQPMPGRKTVHYHGDDQRPDTIAALRNPESGKPLHPIQVQTPPEARFHIAGKKHKGENDQDVHGHIKEKKYTFLAAPVEHYSRSHTHRWIHERHSERLAGHLAKRHKDGAPPGLEEEHEHQYARKARGDAARIDFNTLARDLIEDAEEFFLGLEGSIKAAAMLSNILDTDRKASTASVPSVTLWLAGPKQDELEALVRRYHLAGKRVYIVVDADGTGGERPNPNVQAQALFARDHLRQLGVRAWIVAPPYDPDDLDEKGKPRLNGVDDLLADDGTLDDLHVFRRDPRPFKEIVAWLERRGHPRDRSILRTASNIEALSLFPASNPLKTTARVLRVEKKRQAVAEIEALERLGAITLSEGSTHIGKFYKGRPIPEDWAEHEDKWRRVMYARATLEWVDRPRYEFADGLEAIEQSPVSLRDISDTIPYEGKPLKEVALVKAGPADAILELLANKNGMTVSEVLRSIAQAPTGWFDDRDPDGNPIVWYWTGEGLPSKKDFRDYLILYLWLIKGLEPNQVAPIFGLSVRQVERILNAREGRAGKPPPTGSVVDRWGFKHTSDTIPYRGKL